jgi:acetyl esterase/lipase
MYHLAQRGWLCVACNYRLSPKDAFPAHIVDVKRAIAWIREHAGEYSANTDFIAITGGSAGGHLSSLAALTPNKADWQPGFEEADTSIAAAVPFYGVYDLLDRENIRTGTSMEPILEKYVMQCPVAENREFWADASPVDHVSESAPPTFVLQGLHDSLVWVEEARSFVNKLRGVSEQVVAYGELPGAQHAFEVFHSVRTDHAVNAVTDFLEWCYARR